VTYAAEIRLRRIGLFQVNFFECDRQAGARRDANDGGGAWQAQFAGEAPVSPKPIDLARDGDGALLDAAMAVVGIAIGIETAGWRIVEESLDLALERGLVGIDGQQILGLGVFDGGSDRRIGRNGIDRDERPLRPPPSASRSTRTGMAVISLDLSATASCPSTRQEMVANAETMCSAGLPARRSWLRRDVLPSMAMKSGRSGQACLTQSVKAAENRFGSMRFTRIVSHRPPGTPWS
jgi:hypothetical protein